MLRTQGPAGVEAPTLPSRRAMAAVQHSLEDGRFAVQQTLREGRAAMAEHRELARGGQAGAGRAPESWLRAGQEQDAGQWAARPAIPHRLAAQRSCRDAVCGPDQRADGTVAALGVVVQ